MTNLTAPAPVGTRGTKAVSVVVPVYNVEQYLRQCLDSLVHQTLDDIEIIVVNDGSTDGSLAIAQEYERAFPKVRVISQENQGLSAARNAGMKLACGEYIGFLDSDDWACLDMFESLHGRATRDNADLVIADAKVYWQDRDLVEDFFDRQLWAALPARCKNEPFCIHDEPRALGLEPAAWKRLYKRSFLEAVGFQFPVGLVFEDIPAHFHLLLSAQRISLLDKPVCFYRMDRPGKITARRDRVALQMLDIFALAQEVLRTANADPRVWAEYIRFQTRFCTWIFHQIPAEMRPEFFGRWTAQFRQIPAKAFAAHDREFHKLGQRFSVLCVRKGWRRWFANLTSQKTTLAMKLFLAVHYRP